MAAHNLGGAAQYNAGYQGTWKPGTEKDGTVSALTLSNEFYQIMLDPSIVWINVDASDKYTNTNETTLKPKWQWEGYYNNVSKAPSQDKPFFMLTTDFYVFFNITLDENGKSTCHLDTSCGLKGTCGLHAICGLSPTYAIGLLYAQNNCLFLQDFKKTFTKMLTTGYEKLEP